MKLIHTMLQSTSNSIQQVVPKRTHESYSDRARRLAQELARYEGKLQEWAGRCKVNAIWYLSDPFGAMRSANLGMDEKLISELETLHEEYKHQREAPPVRRTA